MTDRVLGILAFAAFGALIIIIAVAGGNLIPVIEEVRDNAKTTD